MNTSLGLAETKENDLMVGNGMNPYKAEILRSMDSTTAIEWLVDYFGAEIKEEDGATMYEVESGEYEGEIFTFFQAYADIPHLYYEY